ncbi:MAG: hypothetical protein JWP87_474 [Labilithrix sp.]|nr:hypothetical protein [Labilithrix sp.]
MRSLLILFLGVAAAAGTAVACGGGDTANLSDNAEIPGADGDGGGAVLPPSGSTNPSDDGINASGKGAGTGAVTGLPCDVQQLFENRCIGCHLGPNPVALLSYDDLTKKSAADPTKSYAERSLARLKDTASPMPPKPAVAPTPAEIAVLDAWIKAGTPKGAVCTPPPGGADGGADGGATGGTNTNTPLVCTSKQTWNNGNDGSSKMRPGGACITCHSQRGGPNYTVAGTVYPTAHEPNDCNGVNGALTVVVTDKNGVVKNIPVNSVGNFSLGGQIAPPFTVKVTNGVKERAMASALTAGDCNSCHTVTGVNGAPGRVMAP